MHIPRIYINQPLRANTTLVLDKPTVHHLITVMRMKAGRAFVLFNGEAVDGKYGEFSAVLRRIDKKSADVDVGAFTPCQTEASLHIHLGACVIKSDRMDWLLQKATELGVAEVTPLFSDYTDTKLSAERIEKKHQHWQKVAISACEQSGRVLVPRIHSPLKLKHWLPSTNNTAAKIVLHPYVNEPASLEAILATGSPAEVTARHADAAASSATVLVGPEGGLSEQEVTAALDHGFTGMTLGSRILRAETAPLVAIALLMHYSGEC